MRKILTFIGLSLIVTVVQAGYVQVIRNSNVYLEPTSQSEKIETVAKGVQLIEINQGAQTDNYWHVRLADGRDGWIYRSRVRYSDYVSNSLYTAGDCAVHVKYGLPSSPDKLLCRIGYVVGFNHRDTDVVVSYFRTASNLLSVKKMPIFKNWYGIST